jgi:predicted nucleic acid-binding protein
MNIFVDTSALFAVLDADDADHVRALRVWQDLTGRRDHLTCTNYILLETVTLAQKRMGLKAVRLFHESIMPVLRVHWVGVDEHQAAMHALLTANRRQLSLVDCTSFDVMRRLGIRTAFTLDEHFAEQGFECLPERALS